MAKRTKRAKRGTKLSKGVVGTVIAGTLTAAGAGSSGATTFNEPSIGDFSGTFAGANPLPLGTDLVTGSVRDFLDDDDFFRFSGLQGGAAFTIDPSKSGADNPGGEVLASDGSVIDSGSLAGPDLTGFVPNDGVLIFRAFNAISQEGANYEISLSAPLAAPVPAPSALTLTGLGAAIAGAFTWRRRKRAR